jgi:hypothetical protein
MQSVIMLCHSLVISRIDYCSSILFGVNPCNYQKLQRIMNLCVRIILRTKRFDHLTPLFRELKWINIEKKSRNKLSPSYGKSWELTSRHSSETNYQCTHHHVNWGVFNRKQWHSCWDQRPPHMEKEHGKCLVRHRGTLFPNLFEKSIYLWTHSCTDYLNILPLKTECFSYFFIGTIYIFQHAFLCIVCMFYVCSFWEATLPNFILMRYINA